MKAKHLSDLMIAMVKSETIYTVIDIGQAGMEELHKEFNFKIQQSTDLVKSLSLGRQMLTLWRSAIAGVHKDIGTPSNELGVPYLLDAFPNFYAQRNPKFFLLMWENAALAGWIPTESIKWEIARLINIHNTQKLPPGRAYSLSHQQDVSRGKRW